MHNLSRYKQILRNLLGDNLTTWIQAGRFVYLVKTNRLNFEKDIGLLPNFPLQGKIVVDIGANSANWTDVLSKHVGKGGRVFAFEADPYYAMATEKTVWLLGLRNTVFFSFGLSDKAEVLPLAIIDIQGRRVSGTGTIIQDLSLPENRTVNVKLEVLDELAVSYPELWNAALIKCDVEGFELKVFKGAIKILERARPIVIAETAEDTSRDLFDFFYGIHYKSYVTISNNMIRPSSQGGDIPEGQRPNRIFIPEEYPIPKPIQIDS